MTNPKQIGFFDAIQPVTATIQIKENHELLRLAKVIPWSELIEIAMSCRALKVKEIVSKVKSLVHSSHLFAKTKEQKRKVGKKLYHATVELHEVLQNYLSQTTNIKNRSVLELHRISKLMKKLFPQILHFITAGFVAPKKIYNQ